MPANFFNYNNMQNKYLLPFLLLALFSNAIRAQTISWANDVAPILYDHCVKCHRDGGLGGFSLIGYDNAFSYSEAIQTETQAKRMPPWKADPNYRRYAHENRLTDAEIETIGAWVQGGTPMGDMSQAPVAPVFVEGSNVGIPDHVLSTPLYTLSSTEDEYRCFVIPSGLSQNAYLRAVEAIPSNHEAVHHILIYQDVTGEGRLKDEATPEPGYISFGGPGVSANLVGAWAPGYQVTLMPAGTGVKLNANADLIVQMHYPKGAAGLTGQATLNFFFTPTTQDIRSINLVPIINHTPLSLIGGPLSIPGNTVKTYHSKFKLPVSISVLAVAPHMHYIGRSMLAFAVTPQNDTIPLVNVPDWDFHWQASYFFQKAQVIPAQSTLHAFALYDNTMNNPFQPSNPPQLVIEGEATTDEMMLLYFAYMTTKPGDENIIIDSTLLSTALPLEPQNSALSSLVLSPNPAHDGVSIRYEVVAATDLRTVISDLNGRTVQLVADKQDVEPGIYQENVPTGHLPPGLYFVRLLTANGGVLSAKLVKQ